MMKNNIFQQIKMKNLLWRSTEEWLCPFSWIIPQCRCSAWHFQCKKGKPDEWSSQYASYQQTIGYYFAKSEIKIIQIHVYATRFHYVCNDNMNESLKIWTNAIIMFFFCLQNWWNIHILKCYVIHKLEVVFTTKYPDTIKISRTFS